MSWKVVLSIILAVAAFADADFDFQDATPDSQGISTEKLNQFRDSMARLHTECLLVLRHDKVILEWYAPGFSAKKLHGTASLAKGVTGGLSFALAMQDHLLKSDDPASRFVSEWKSDPVKSKITLAQLATHSSGLDDAEEDRIPHAKLTGWKGDFWKRTPDPFTLSRDDCQVVFAPGEKVRYSNPGIAMLGYAVTAALKDAPQKDIRAYLRERLYRPIGIADKEWSIGYGQTYKVDGLPLVATWGGGAFTARALARIGRLLLRKGDWDGQRLLDPAIVRLCTDAPGAPAAKQWEGPDSARPGYGFWTNLDDAWKAVPRDAYMAAGAGHQLLIVIPSLDMVVVRNGQTMTNEPNWLCIEKNLLNPLMGCITDPPYPPSRAIRDVRFDPQILRQAIDSDNWPMTFGDDGQMYTAYGDGRGFEPFGEKKLSLGIARVEGSPPDFHGVNLRSRSIERTGDGPKGPKASGLLMVDKTLYMWVRNTKNATLAWSEDHGRTWTWGFTFTQSFGCPTFLNFGANYEGAPDDYVYIYSPDADDAYTPADGLVLARVRKSHIREKGAYEFFVSEGKWSGDISKRGAAFVYPSHCYRPEVVYDAPLKRYILALSLGQNQGWGLFDAPGPTGPWTTILLTHQWDVPKTHGYRLPTQWISNDGRGAWLVFSGLAPNDAFCARRMTFDLYP